MEIYRHVGERARTDLMKKAGGAGIAEARLRTITARFDEVRDAGQMITDLEEGECRYRKSIVDCREPISEGVL